MTEVFEAGLDGIIVFDHQGTVLQFSPAAERQFGYPRSEAVGRNLADLVIPARLRQTDGMGLERSLAGASDLAPTRLELTAMRRDGTEVPVELTLGRRRSTPPTFVAFVRDISEGRRAEERRTRVEQEAERHRRVVAELARLGSVVARSLNPIEVAREIVRSARELLNVPVAEVYELSAGSRDLRVLACDADPRHGFDPYPVLPAGCGAAGAAVEDLRSLVTPDVLGDPRIRLPAEVRASFERTPFLAALAVPLVAQEHALGALVVRDETGRTFDVGAVAMVTAFAHHAAIALEKAQLYEEAEGRRREAELFRDLATQITATLDLDGILERATAGARALCWADMAHIALRDERSGDMVFRYMAETPVGLDDAIRVELGKGFGGIVLATGRPQRTENYLADPRISPDYAEFVRRLGVVSQLAVPIWIGDRIEGLVYVANRTHQPFTDHDVETLTRLAAHAALAIRNAALYGQEQAARARLAVLREIDQALLVASSTSELALSALRPLRRLVPYVRASVALFDFEAREARLLSVVADATVGLGAGARIPLEVFGTLGDLEAGKVHVVSDLEGIADAFPGARTLIGEGVRTWMHVPLVCHGDLLGTLNLGVGELEDVGEADVEVVQHVAESLAVGMAQARLHEQLVAGRDRLSVVSRRLVTVQEAERRRLARELHDEIGQILTGLKLSLDLVARSFSPETRGHDAPAPAYPHEALERMRTVVGDLIHRVRDLSLDLRPSMLDDLGLVPALLWHFERYTAQTGVRIEFRQSGVDGRRFSPEIETAGYRIIQEALTNVARHAGTGEATVRLWSDGSTLGVQIEDAGAGFCAERAPSADRVGLAGMRERAVLLGGRLDVDGMPGAGVRVTAELPLDGRVERREHPR